MLKIYMRLLGFARPIQKYAIPYFFYSLLYALFNSLTFLLIMPILKTMFDADYTFVYVEKLPPLAFNQEYLTALFNFTYSHLFNEYNPENVLLMLAVVTIFVSLLSNLFRYLGSWTVENMRTRTPAHRIHHLDQLRAASCRSQLPGGYGADSPHRLCVILFLQMVRERA